MRSTVTRHTAIDGVRQFRPDERPTMPEWRRRQLETFAANGGRIVATRDETRRTGR